MSNSPSFLRIPPFPSVKGRSLAVPGATSTPTDSELDRIIDRIRTLRVGGAYWADQPDLPEEPYTVVRSRDHRARAEAVAASKRPVLAAKGGDQAHDPWHLVSRAVEVVVDSGDELALVAAIAGVKVRCIGNGPFSGLESGDQAALRGAFLSATAGTYRSPFTTEPMDLAEAVELCAFWRRLIDSNRGITAAVGFAFWKRATVAPLLWAGQGAVPFTSSVPYPSADNCVAVWKSRADAGTLQELERSPARLVEVEDGFIRSAGLGADCVPPLSIVVDRLGIYFDPHRPSDLECLLENGDFPAGLLERAGRLRNLIVESGISKYAVDTRRVERPSDGRLRLLVPGQVEDDRAVMEGAGPRTNRELLRRVRDANPDAYILYKPHPDVEAGHRVGAIAEDTCLELANEVLRETSISAAIALVDEIHVNSSLAGFEALLRGRPVTTYGVPFYAGWGLTHDLGPVPERRTARRTLDELVAAALLLYPRYLDPVTNLPCPPEILIRRLSETQTGRTPGAIVRLRRLQGRWNRAVSALRARA